MSDDDPDDEDLAIDEDEDLWDVMTEEHDDDDDEDEETDDENGDLNAFARGPRSSNSSMGISAKQPQRGDA